MIASGVHGTTVDAAKVAMEGNERLVVINGSLNRMEELVLDNQNLLNPATHNLVQVIVFISLEIINTLEIYYGFPRIRFLNCSQLSMEFLGSWKLF